MFITFNNLRYQEFLIFENMLAENLNSILTENHLLDSIFLNREVNVDFYLPTNVAQPSEIALLLINDGQDLRTMNFKELLENLYTNDIIAPLLCVGIHCSNDRMNEYGTANILDYKGRGTMSASYNRFIFEELIPFIHQTYCVPSFKEKSFAGFSLGGLSALDIVWNHPQEFTKAGIFSASLWWRDKDQNDPTFDENKNRIMQRQIREGYYYPWLKFFFEVGTLDETADRNKNGIIDAIDDTTSLIDALTAKGYDRNNDIKYLELKDGRHDVATWALAFPYFLKWGWGK